MKKKLLLAPLMAALVACVVLLSGCGGPSVEELITNDLTSQFDEIKNGGDDFLSGLEEASGDEFEQLGIDPKEYAKSYLEGFDYKIGDVTVDEDKGTATAEVTITCKSMNKIVEDFATQYQEKVAALDTMPSEDDLYKMAGQVMVDVTKAAKTKDTKVTFKYSANEDIDIGIAHIERGCRIGAQLLHHMQRDGRFGLGRKRINTALYQRKALGTKYFSISGAAETWSLLVSTASCTPAARRRSSISIVPA